MPASPEQLARATTAAKALEAEGYFARVAEGDQRAASYFARLTAHRLNPSARTSDYGCLSKAPGETQVDGFAEDAIVFGADPADLHNVVDLVVGAGAPGAAIADPAQQKERREHNRWVAPAPLTPEQLNYLRPGSAPPVVHFPPRDETFAFGVAANEQYRAKGAPQNGTIRLLDGTERPRHLDFEGEIVWLQQYLLYRVNGESHLAATEKVLAEIDAAWPKK